MVPWNANELTPQEEGGELEEDARPLLCLGADRAPARACAGRDEAMCGLSELRWRMGWTRREWMEEREESMPMMPAEGSVCPMPLLSAAKTSGLGRALSPCVGRGSSTAAAAPTSMGSPSPVPVGGERHGVEIFV